MHAIMFCGTAEEAGPDRDLDAYAGPELEALAAGDVLWLVGRLADERQSPALIGRLVVDRVEGPGARPFEAGQEDRALRVVADPGRSERCAPVGCPMIRSWAIWRHAFGGVVPLAREQAESLEQFWTDAAALRRPRR